MFLIFLQTGHWELPVEKKKDNKKDNNNNNNNNNNNKNKNKAAAPTNTLSLHSTADLLKVKKKNTLMRNMKARFINVFMHFPLYKTPKQCNDSNQEEEAEEEQKFDNGCRKKKRKRRGLQTNTNTQARW